VKNFYFRKKAFSIEIGYKYIQNLRDIMQIHFSRIIQFSRQLKAGNRQREFNFKKLNNVDPEQFSVNVSDERGERILFSMKKHENKWEIVPTQLPSWILQSEARLHEIIEDELTQNN
jgi:hypothetical protein